MEPVMTDTLELLQTRRSVPAIALTAPGPDAAQIETLLTIASRVPDHGKLAPWRFVLFAGDARQKASDGLHAILSAREGADPMRIEQAKTALSRAPLVIMVVSRAAPHVKIAEWEQVLSAGAVCMNIVTAATAMGFGVNWLTEWFAYDAQAHALLGLSASEKVAGFIHIGTPKERLSDRPRPELAQIVSVWG
jgi:nitroreductase